MSLIKIYSTTGVEIEYKKDTLTLKKENNSLSSDFKVPHSSFPFLIIENDVAKSVLGPSDIASIRKNKIIPVIILEDGVRYYGELQQLTLLKKFRKCNLKYGSDLIPIVNKKISEFLPVVSVIPGVTNPVPFAEEGTTIIAGSQYWQSIPVTMMGQIYPEAKFQFPKMYWLNKYGVGLEPEDPWYQYKNYVNNFGRPIFTNTQVFLQNTATVSGSTITVYNQNVPIPHLFILTPLHYIFSSLGWKTSGDFTEHELIKRLLMVPKKDNICKTTLSPVAESITLPSTSWTLTPNGGVLGRPIYRKDLIHNAPNEGTYKLKYSFTLQHLPASTAFDWQISRLTVNPPGDDNTVTVFQKYISQNNGNYYLVEGEVELQSEAGNMVFTFEDSNQNMPVSYSLELTLLGGEKEFNQMHPTIELGRYAPDWSVGNYLNYLKTKFNLDITLDDFKKEITLKLNENITVNETPAIISQSLAMTSYDVAANTSFVLKEENDQDPALYITQEEVIPYTGTSSELTKVIESKFKTVPHNNVTSVLSEDLNEKEGVGLVIYHPFSAPFTAENTENGFRLSIPGSKGIYEVFFKRWIKFLLNASQCEMTGYFTETEISKLNKAKAVYINNQRFRVISTEMTEGANNFKQVKLLLLSVNY